MYALRMLLSYALLLFQLLILARVILSWIPAIDRYHPIGRFIWDLTEPILRPVRNFLMSVLPANFPLDLSPLVVLLLLSVLSRLIL